MDKFEFSQSNRITSDLTKAAVAKLMQDFKNCESKKMELYVEPKVIPMWMKEESYHA